MNMDAYAKHLQERQRQRCQPPFDDEARKIKAGHLTMSDEDEVRRCKEACLKREEEVRKKLLDVVRAEYGEDGILWHKVFALLKASLVVLQGAYSDANATTLWEQFAIAMLNEAADSEHKD